MLTETHFRFLKYPDAHPPPTTTPTLWVGGGGGWGCQKNSQVVENIIQFWTKRLFFTGAKWRCEDLKKLSARPNITINIWLWTQNWLQPSGNDESRDPAEIKELSRAPSLIFMKKQKHTRRHQDTEIVSQLTFSLSLCWMYRVAV